MYENQVEAVQLLTKETKRHIQKFMSRLCILERGFVMNERPTIFSEKKMHNILGQLHIFLCQPMSHVYMNTSCHVLSYLFATII